MANSITLKGLVVEREHRNTYDLVTVNIYDRPLPHVVSDTLAVRYDRHSAPPVGTLLSVKLEELDG